MSDELLRARFEFILESVTLIQTWFQDIKSPDDYLATSLGKSHFDATLMRLQAIGETLKKIDAEKPQLFSMHPSSSWRDIIRLREIISHHYDQLSHEIIFNICSADLPVLKKDVLKIIEQLKK